MKKLVYQSRLNTQRIITINKIKMNLITFLLKINSNEMEHEVLWRKERAF